MADDNIVPFPQLLLDERVVLLQLAESERAQFLSDAIAALGYGRGATQYLSAADQQTCRRLGAYVLRASKPAWVKAATDHAIERVLSIGRVNTIGEARAMAEEALAAYLGILDGSIVLPAETYLKIVDGGQ
jgi:hypothetical protein